MKDIRKNRAIAVTPIAFVIAISKAYEKYGLSFTKALEMAQIAPCLLKDPEARVTAVQFEALSDHAMRELNDEGLGWFSRRLPWGSHGLLCRAAITAPSLEVALKRWCRSHGLLVEDIHLSLRVQAGIATVAISECCRLSDDLREFCLVSVLRMIHGFACWLIDSRIPLMEVALPFPPPDHISAYRAMFPGEACFNADKARFSFDATYLSLSPVRDEKATRAMLQKALPLTILPYRRDRLLVERVRTLLQARLLANLPTSSLPNAEELAEILHVSSRTLHRQLREEGSSIQKIKDELRKERALELLRRSQKSLKQIAHLTGFNNEKSFSRAFRLWTGISPGQMRFSP